MKLKSGVTFLAVLFVLLAAPAYAAKITIGDQGGFVDVGAIVQVWARSAENGATDHAGPSYDIFFRRMRFYVNGAVNAQFGIIANTDVSYGQGSVTNATGVVTNPETAQNVVKFASPTIILNEALGYWNVAPAFKLWVGLQLLPWVHESMTDITRFASLDEQVDATERGRPGGNANSFVARDRNMGIVFTGDLAFINYRIGVFSQAQSFAGSSVYTASGLISAGSNKLGAPVADVYYAPYGTVNPGDSPSFDGAIRINIVGIEPGYAYAGGIAYDGKTYISVGGGANIAPRAIASVSRSITTNYNTATYQGYFADLHMDVPFGDNEFVLEAGWVRTVYSGNGAPVYAGVAAGQNLVSNAGNAYYGSIGVRIAWIYPYFAMDVYQSNLPDASARSSFIPTGSSAFVTYANATGSVQGYHGGLKFFPGGPVGNCPMINLDMYFQNKANAGNTTNNSPVEAINGNQWAGTLEFEWKI